MPDHVHALLYGGEEFKISQFMQVWKKTSSYRIRRFFSSELTAYSGLIPEASPIWQPRFYDFNVESDNRFNQKIEYMHQNPVAAKLTESALLWRWSSARFYELEEPVGVTITPIF